MENNLSAQDAASARAALADVDAAKKAVKDAPWPTWLYFENAALLTLMGLSLLLGEPAWIWGWCAIGVAILVVNLGAARAMGISSALPSSVAFLTCVGVAIGLLVVPAVLREAAFFPVGPALIVPCALGAGVVYLVGSAIHYRSTRR